MFVHRYKWSHDKLRKKYRRLRKEGKVVVVNETKDGWTYSKKENNHGI